jgi:hypothetical protein
MTGGTNKPPGDSDGRVAGFADETFDTSEYKALRLLFRDECTEGLDRLAQVLLGPKETPDWVELAVRATYPRR